MSGEYDDGELPGDADRTIIRITADVGAIYGIDSQDYELAAGDVIELPTVNAELLVERDAAARVTKEGVEQAEGVKRENRVDVPDVPDDDRPVSTQEADAVAGDRRQETTAEKEKRESVSLWDAAVGGDEEALEVYGSNDGPDTSPSSTNEKWGTPMAESVLPVGHLDRLEHNARKRAAKKRGAEWPSTRELRERHRDEVMKVMQNSSGSGHNATIVVTPTSGGKSYNISTTPWTVDETLEQVTGGAPVVHLLPTRDARDDCLSDALENGARLPGDPGHGPLVMVLYGRTEACSVAAGDHDPGECACEEDEDEGVTVSASPSTGSPSVSSSTTAPMARVGTSARSTATPRKTSTS